jgi:hypothetical protein
VAESWQPSLKLRIGGCQKVVNWTGSRGALFVGAYVLEDPVDEQQLLAKSTRIIHSLDTSNNPADCQLQRDYQSKRNLSRLRMRKFLKLAFLNPEIAAGNDLLISQPFGRVPYSHQ